MASAQHPNRVYFTSLDRSPVDTNTDFTITFDTPIENSKNFEVVSAAFPNTFNQFAGYETVLYFYHELFQSGATAIGIPLSITPFLLEGKTGESSLPSARPTGRKQYIDGRYFLDGADLADYLTDWLNSLSATGGTDFPAASTGLCPFYFASDDPTGPATFFANEAATGVDFSTLSFAFDNTTALGGLGSLKLVFADSDAHVVRVASVVDFGSLGREFTYPSLISYKLGYTDLQFEAFGTVSITPANNQFTLFVTYYGDGGGVPRPVYTIPPNDYSPSGLAAAIQTILRTTNKDYPSSEFVKEAVVTEAGGILTFVFTPPQPPIPPSFYHALYAIRSLGDPIQVACLNTLGLIPFEPSVQDDQPLVATNAVTLSTPPTPDDHLASDPINLIRTSNVYFASSLSAGESLSSAGRKDVLFAVPLTSPVGSVQLYQSTLSGVIVNRPPSVVRNLRVTLLDDNFQIMESMPQNSSISVEIHFSYDDENNTNNVSLNPYSNK
jgi:hypothetical protein